MVCQGKHCALLFCHTPKHYQSGKWWQLTELACFLAWLISSLICEMLRLRLSCSLLMGCSFSKSRSASSSKSFTLAPAAWTARGLRQKEKGQATTQGGQLRCATGLQLKVPPRANEQGVKAEKRDNTYTREDVWGKKRPRGL